MIAIIAIFLLVSFLSIVVSGFFFYAQERRYFKKEGLAATQVSYARFLDMPVGSPQTWTYARSQLLAHKITIAIYCVYALWLLLVFTQLPEMSRFALKAFSPHETFLSIAQILAVPARVAVFVGTAIMVIVPITSGAESNLRRFSYRRIRAFLIGIAVAGFYLGGFYFIGTQVFSLSIESFNWAQPSDIAELMGLLFAVPVMAYVTIRSRPGEVKPNLNHITFLELESHIEISRPESIIELCDKYGMDAVGESLIEIYRDDKSASKREMLRTILNRLETTALAEMSYPRLRYYIYSRLAGVDDEINKRMKVVVDDVIDRSALAKNSSVYSKYVEPISRRALEASIAILALIFFTVIPVIPAITIVLLLRWDEENGLLFVSPRRGENGDVFDLYQFRAHRIQTETKRQIGRLGRMLLWSGLDKLPSLVNVIKGDMSLFGPHPMYDAQIGALALVYPNKIDSIRQRLRIKPGIFGATQLHAMLSPNAGDCRTHLEMDIAQRGRHSVRRYVGNLVTVLFVWLTYMLPNAILVGINVFRAPRRPPPLEPPYVPISTSIVQGLQAFFHLDPGSLGVSLPN